MKKYLLLAMVACISISVYSQGKIGIHVGASFPTGDYGTTDFNNEDAVGMSTGVNFGVQYQYSFNNFASIYGGVDYMSHGFSDDTAEKSTESLDLPVGASVKYPKFNSIPFSAGVELKTEVSNNVHAFGQVGPAINFLSIGNMKVSYAGQSMNVGFDADPHLGLRVGGGLRFGKLSLSATYFNFGKHDMQTSFQSEIEENEIAVSMLNVTLGVLL